MGNFSLKFDKFWETFIKYNGYVKVLEGLKNTLTIAVLGLIIGIVIGTLIATARVIPQYKVLPRILNKICSFYVALFRGTPIVVQLLVFYYVLLPLMGSRMTGIQVAVMVFGLNSAAYISEIMRGGIMSVDSGQMEAGRAVGLSFGTTMLKIVIPQAVKNILPTMGNELIALIKDTLVVSFVGATDLYVAFSFIGSSNYEFMVPYLVMALIYIVEDDENIREIETIALKNSNYMVCAFEKATTFYKKLEDIMPDLVLLDVMLPDESGYDIVRKLRKNPATKKLPIIMVTAKTAEMDMIKGLDEGADDYIKKPFSIMELITRVKALLRRTETEDVKILQVENITLDHERHMVFVDDKPVELTFKEYELLRLLMTNPSVVLSREVIMRHVWGTEFEGESRTVDMHIKTLRQKLGEAGSKIRTVRNVGYVIE